MSNSINNEDFYHTLDPRIKSKIQEVYIAKGGYERLAMASIIIYSIIGLIFIYMFKDIIFTTYYFFTLNSLFQFCKILIVISGAIFITSSINKMRKDIYNKAVISLRKLFVMDICNCNSTCSCKNSLISHLEKQGINLLS
ncbi:MAG TPA: hypothetical protein VIK26_02680 [Clostridium sp.]